MEVMTMASGQGFTNNNPSSLPQQSTKLPSLQDDYMAPIPRPGSLTSAVDARDVSVELPRLVGTNTLNPGPPKDEREEAERRKRIMTMNQKMSKMGPAGVRQKSFIIEDDVPSIDTVPYQPQVFNNASSIPSLRRVEVVGISLPTLHKDNTTVSQVHPTFTSRLHTTDRSSTVTKKMAVGYPRRHGEMWAPANSDISTSSVRMKGVILHADRYQWDELVNSSNGLTQKERLHLEHDYVSKMRNFKRTRELVPHRENHDMMMGGTRVYMFERMDIMGEIAKLKSIVLPAKAKELYVGKGFRLPENHALNKPRVYSLASKGKTKKKKVPTATLR